LQSGAAGDWLNGRRLAVVHEVLRSIGLQMLMNSHSELELDTLRNIQPIEVGVKQMCEYSDHPSCIQPDETWFYYP